MKITGTRSYIKVTFEGKTVKISGEMIVGGFVADKNSIRNWEPPYNDKSINDTEKQNIIDAVINKTKISHMIITFE